MITVTLSFNTSEEALAALKKLEGTAAEPAALGKSVKPQKAADTQPTAAPAQADAPAPKDDVSVTPPAPLDFKRDLAPPFIALATTEGGPDKQRAVLAHFKVDRLSGLKPEQYGAALQFIKGLS